MQSEIQTQITNVWTPSSEEKMGKLGDWDWYIYTTILKIDN